MLFRSRDWEAVIAHLQPRMAEHERIGGSRAQRDLIEYTLMAALTMAGRGADAAKLVVRGARTRSVAVS